MTKKVPRPDDMGWVYFLQMSKTNLIKIGFATDIEGRIANLRTANPFALELIDEFRAARKAEKMLHRLLKPIHYSREWYRGLNTIEAIIEEIDRWRIGHACLTAETPDEAMQCLQTDCSRFIEQVCEAGLEAYA